MRVLAARVGPGAERVAGARQHDRADVVATAGAQSSRFASMLGSMMVSVALAFAVLEITDSATALGLVLAAHTIPMVIFLLFGA